MGEFESIRFDNIVRKKRTLASRRRPQSNSYPVFECPDFSPCSSSPHSNDLSKLSSDENTGYDASIKRKQFNLNQCISKGNENGRNGLISKRSDVVVERIDCRGKVKDVPESHSKSKNGHSGRNGEIQKGDDNKVRKLKLKVGGVTRTIDGSSALKKIVESSVSSQDISGSGFYLSREDSSMGKSDPGRKSKRVPKKRHFDDDDDDDDDEIRYMEKLKTFKVHASSRVSKLGKADEVVDNSGSSRSGKDRKKPISNRASADIDYEVEDELLCNGDFVARKKPREESIDLLMESKREITLTTRQRALHLGKDISSAPSASLEFPNGLPPAPSRKQKDKLTEVEQQAKKAEAAQRRRAQNEKAARESEAEAIRKILGQDSNRKKKEDKIKKRQEELAQERAANALTVAPNTIRWVMGPTGTIVTFSNDLGLPSLFNSKPSSYPPPREICAGPSCTNAYKYRDSKSKLPLCSLKCYKAVQVEMQDSKPPADSTCPQS